MNIDGLGPRVLEQMFDKSLVKDGPTCTFNRRTIVDP